MKKYWIYCLLIVPQFLFAQAKEIPRVLINGIPLEMDVAAATYAKATYRTNCETQISWSSEKGDILILDEDSVTTTLNINDFEKTTLNVKKDGLLQIDVLPETNTYQIYDYNHLDVGIYFYGKGNNCQKLGDKANPYFDPTKPTVIYAHGLQTGGVAAHRREDFHFKYDSTDVYTHEKWLEDGWNVGVFYWLQLADETMIWRAEMKINNCTTSVKMPWKNARNEYLSVDMPEKTVADLYADEYEKAFSKNYSGKEIRLVGNSFGGQLTMQMALRLHERNIKPMPARLALLDPAWLSKGVQFYSKPHGFWWTGNVSIFSARKMIKKYDIAIEYYRSSILTKTMTAKRMARLVAFQHMKLFYTSSVVNKHTFIVDNYFWSYSFPPPIEIHKKKETKEPGLSAATSNERVKKMMRRRRHWKHVEGRYTTTPEDDKFKRRKRCK